MQDTEKVTMLTPREVLPDFELSHLYMVLVAIGTALSNYYRPVLSIFILSMISAALGYIIHKKVIIPVSYMTDNFISTRWRRNSEEQ